MGGGGQRTMVQVIIEAPTATTTAITAATRTSDIPLTEDGRTILSPSQQPLQQQQQSRAIPATSAKPFPRSPARNIYENREFTPFWNAPLIVAIAANIIWPATLLVLTMWSMLVVLYFRLTRYLTENLLRTPAVHVHDGDDAPVDMGLYFFGLDNRCEKWIPSPSPLSGSSSLPAAASSSTFFFGGTKKNKSTNDLPLPRGHCQFFDPNKPTVIYVHGFSRRTTARRFRETFNWSNNDKQYGLDINSADRWVREGWNIGIFFWNNHADEEMPQDTESKIWTSNGRCGMRYRTFCPKKGHVTFYTSSRPSSSISQQLANLLTDVFYGSRAPYRLVGHSLGTQLVVHATTLLSQQKDREEKEAAAATVTATAAAATAAAVAAAGAAAIRAAKEVAYGNGKERKKAIKTVKRMAVMASAAATATATTTAAAAAAAAQKPPVQLPTRICLLDAFATLGVKAYLSGWPVMMVVQREVVALRDLGIVFEQYQTSMIGRRGLLLRHLTAFVQLDPPDIPWYRLRARHVAAVHMYFLSFSHSVDGPKLKKADLRRHQSAEICFSLINGKGGSLATGLSALNGNISENSSSSSSSSSSAWMTAASCIGLPALAAKAAAPPSSFASSLRTSASLSLLSHRKSQNKLILEMDLQNLLQPPQIEDDETPCPNTALRYTTATSSSTTPTTTTSSSISSPRSVGFSAILRRRLPPPKSSALSNSNLTTLQESIPLPPLTIAIPPPLPPVPTTHILGPQQQQQQHGRHRHERYSPRAYDGHNMNHLRWLKSSNYKEVEVGDFPLMARASDAEVRELMKCNYVYKQYHGHLFLRVSRAW